MSRPETQVKLHPQKLLVRNLLTPLITINKIDHFVLLPHLHLLHLESLYLHPSSLPLCHRQPSLIRLLPHLHPSHRLLPTYKQNPLFRNVLLVLPTSPGTRMDRPAGQTTLRTKSLSRKAFRTVQHHQDTLPMQLHLGIDMLRIKQHVLLTFQKQVPEHYVNQHKPSVELNRCGRQIWQKILLTPIPQLCQTEAYQQGHLTSQLPSLV